MSLVPMKHPAEAMREYSQAKAAEVRKSAGVPDPNFSWQNEACDESGVPVASVPKHACDADSTARFVDGYFTKDSGDRTRFHSGAVRDCGTGKGAYALIPPRPLHRLAQLCERGARKYDDENWRKGMNFKRVIESMIRHAFQYLENEDHDEDHLAAVAWNAFALMEYEEAIRRNQLPADLDDRFHYENHTRKVDKDFRKHFNNQ